MDSLPDNSNSDNELDPFFELSPDLLCIAGFDGYFKRINPAVSKLLGYTDQELFAKPINEFVHPADRILTSEVREQLTKNKPLFNYENRYLTKGGDIVWLSWTSLPVDGSRLIYAITKDITHKKKIEFERNVLLSNLTKLNKDLKRINYTTSHDLRAPVNNLLSVFNLLDINRIEHPETRQFINILKSSAQNLKQTLDDYVDVLSQKESLNEQIENISLEDALNTVTSSLKTLIHISNTSLQVDFSGLTSIKFNKIYLESIFLNLITNSIKYARPDTSPVISIYSQITDGIPRLVISDNGLGFDMDKVSGSIFGFQQKFHNDMDSKGIGLYLVYSHITSLGGQISVASRVNEGTAFTITFRRDYAGTNIFPAVPL